MSGVLSALALGVRAMVGSSRMVQGRGPWPGAGARVDDMGQGVSVLGVAWWVGGGLGSGAGGRKMALGRSPIPHPSLSTLHPTLSRALTLTPASSGHSPLLGSIPIFQRSPGFLRGILPDFLRPGNENTPDFCPG